jgi:hypothetical protein
VFARRINNGVKTWLENVDLIYDFPVVFLSDDGKRPQRMSRFNPPRRLNEPDLAILLCFIDTLRTLWAAEHPPLH